MRRVPSGATEQRLDLFDLCGHVCQVPATRLFSCVWNQTTSFRKWSLESLRPRAAISTLCLTSPSSCESLLFCHETEDLCLGLELLQVSHSLTRLGWSCSILVLMFGIWGQCSEDLTLGRDLGIKLTKVPEASASRSSRSWLDGFLSQSEAAFGKEPNKPDPSE